MWRMYSCSSGLQAVGRMSMRWKGFRKHSQDAAGFAGLDIRIGAFIPVVQWTDRVN